MRGQLKVTYKFSTTVRILWTSLFIDPKAVSATCFKMFVKVLLGTVSLYVVMSLCVSVEHRPVLLSTGSEPITCLHGGEVTAPCMERKCNQTLG